MTQTPPASGPDRDDERPRTRREARLAERSAGHPFAGLTDHQEDHGGDRSDGESLAWSQEHYPARERKRGRSGWRRLIGVLVAVAIVVGLGVTAYSIFQPQVAKLASLVGGQQAPDDYTGNGHGKIVVTIASGDTGSDVARTLHKDGVTKSVGAFYSLIVGMQPSPVFQPGAYKLAKQMSAKSALEALQNPKNRLQASAVIPEGTTEKGVLAILAKGTKVPLADLQAAAANVSAYGLPPQAKTLEGFLFPATYTFNPGVTADQIIKTLVDRSFQALDADGVSVDNRWNTVILASIVQREAGSNTEDFGKIARVFQNRLDAGMPLQSDATVSYGVGSTDRVQTTPAERADASNPYNTYAHTGLPVGPISNPGDVAIKAAANPTPGPWLYFVAVNLKTGETVFSATYAEHEAAVKQLDQWCHESPENNAYCK